MDNFKSHTIEPDFDHKFYGDVLGVTNGHCENVYIEEGDKLKEVLIYHDRVRIRLMEFKTESGEV